MYCNKYLLQRKGKSQLFESKTVMLATYVIIRHRLSYPKLFLPVLSSINFAHYFIQLKTTFMHLAKAHKIHKYRTTAIRNRRILFSRENSKLCLRQPEILRASQDNLPFPAVRDGFLQSRKPAMLPLQTVNFIQA